MAFYLSPEDFKKLISESMAIEAFLGRYSNIVKPDIAVAYSDNAVVVSGDFKLTEILIFEKGEEYKKTVIIDGGIYKDIIFRGGSFERLIFRRGIYDGYVSIAGGHINNLILRGGTFNHWLGTINGINNRENNKPLADEPLKIDRFEIEGGSYATNLWISGGEIDRMEVKCVTPVKIHCKPNDDEIFDATKFHYKPKFNSAPNIKDLIISRYSHKDNFYHFSDMSIFNLRFENFTNLGTITIAKLSIKEGLTIQNSDLGKTTFIDCNFSLQKMYFDSSKITEIALAGVLLPEPKEIISLTGQERLALSQLKKVYRNMGDSVNAAKYQAHELETYRGTLKWGGEKVNLSLNNWSNRYGLDWVKSLRILVIGVTLFYSAYCFALGFSIVVSINGILLLIKNAGYFLEFLNPIRKSELYKTLVPGMDESNVPVSAIFIDSVSKIFTAYILYQFIAAFRKHGKKSD